MTTTLAMRIADIVKAIGIHRSSLEQAIRKGEFPRPDRYLNKTPLQKTSTVETWLSESR